MRRLPCIFLLLLLPLCLVAQNNAPTQNQSTVPVEASVKGKQENVSVKKVSFNPGRRNPFLSKEEVIKIEQMRKAEQRRLAAEEAERQRKAEEERKRLLQQQILEEELRRYPARAVMYKIRVDGILGKEAIVNGEVVGIGSKVLGAKVVSVTDDSVWFVYKGQRFQRKLPLL